MVRASRPHSVVPVSLRVATVRQVAAFVVGGLVLVALYVLALWRAPDLLVNQDLLHDPGLGPEHHLAAEHSARLIVISIGGAMVVVTGLLYTARNYRLAHRGQVTERFTKALERLGSDEIYVRIGGVHALEHVMRDSPEHHSDVVEVLVAFIRGRAPRRADELVDEGRWMHPPIGTDTPELPSEPDADVQVAFRVLGRRPNRPNIGEQLDFHELHIQGVHLLFARLQYANLKGAQLQGADLWVAQLQTADLRQAQLQGARLRNARLRDADLREAQLRDADYGKHGFRGRTCDKRSFRARA